MSTMKPVEEKLSIIAKSLFVSNGYHFTNCKHNGIEKLTARRSTWKENIVSNMIVVKCKWCGYSYFFERSYIENINKSEYL